MTGPSPGPASAGTVPAVDAWHALPAEEVVARLARDGLNALRRGDQVSAWTLLAGQFTSLVIWVLIGAALVAMALGQRADGIAILAIVILNAAIGFFQEHRASRAMAALARLAAPRTRVLRGGHAKLIEATEVVRGDVLLLEGGDLVAADARLLEGSALRINEAHLTGESQPADKRVGTCPPQTPAAGRRNMAFFGTGVVSGSGRAVVTATGMSTEVGRIAELLATARHDQTPLQRRLDQAARRLLWISVGIVALVFVLA